MFVGLRNLRYFSFDTIFLKNCSSCLKKSNILCQNAGVPIGTISKWVRGGGGLASPIIVRQNWGLKGRKKFLVETGSPISKVLDDLAPPPPITLISRSQGSGTASFTSERLPVLWSRYGPHLWMHSFTKVLDPWKRLPSKSWFDFWKEPEIERSQLGRVWWKFHQTDTIVMWSRYVCMMRALWGAALSWCNWIQDRPRVRAVDWICGRPFGKTEALSGVMSTVTSPWVSKKFVNILFF